jgi:large subunit ribosomal protein L29
MPSKAVELRELPDEELYVRMESAKEELFNLRFQLATGQLDNTSRMKSVRHDVARIATVLRERHLESEIEEELARTEAEVLERGREAQASGELKGTSLAELEKEGLEEIREEREAEAVSDAEATGADEREKEES